MSLSKWLSRDNGPQSRAHLSPLMQHEAEEENRDDSTMTIASTNGLRRASLVRFSFHVLSDYMSLDAELPWCHL